MPPARKTPVATIALMAGLAGCAGGEGASPPGNAAEFCRAEGLSTGTPAYEACIDDYVAARCAAAGPAGGEAYAACERQVRERVLVRNELQIRGY